MKNSKSVFICSNCGSTSPKWLGKCPDCGAWNSYEEEIQKEVSIGKNTTSKRNYTPSINFQDLELPKYIRYTTGMEELDRVLGGGIVEGEVILLSGEPGIGKSTLLLQICETLAQNKKVLYVSGEESRSQLKLRYQRLHIESNNIWLLTATSSEDILAECENIHPDVVIIDSIQTISTEKSSTSPGSLTQVREASLSFITYAKENATAFFLIGHVNKEGGISGPKVLEHMVDAVLYFEGERSQAFRVIRAMKNRYGSTNEIGVFDMTDEGLKEISNPSELMISEHPFGTSGNCAGCVMEGTRPLITEIQALASDSVFSSPKRAAIGFDYNRMCLLLAVLEKRFGVKFSTKDVYLNLAGGIRPNDPAADFAVVMALLSSYTDKIVPDDLIAIGEIGLSGEVRPVSNADYRVKESIRLGFKTILIPSKNMNPNYKNMKDVHIVGVKGVFEALIYLKNTVKENVIE